MSTVMCDCENPSIFLRPRRALVMILEEQPGAGVSESALLNETALAEDWNRPEEEEAWSYLQPVQEFSSTFLF